VTAHDGFTLRDLVSYGDKHNEPNGEENRDGSDSNWSCNWGEEGETGTEAILRRRARMTRNLLASLAFSQGVPMISHGDELGRTQRGNNNAYCQDNEISWLDWELDAERLEMLDFTRQVLALREQNPVLRRRSFFSGTRNGGVEKDVTWLRPDGAEMDTDDWQAGDKRALAMLVPGEANSEVDERGRPIQGDTLLLIFNAGTRPVLFRLPKQPAPGRWELALRTDDRGTRRLRAPSLRVGAQSLYLLIYRSGS
jgi:glycogen operon protein